MNFRQNTLTIKQTLCLAVPKGLPIIRFVRVLPVKLSNICQPASPEDEKGSVDTKVFLLMSSE